MLMAVAVRSKARGRGALQLRQRPAEDTSVYQEWWEPQRMNMKFVEPAVRQRLVKRPAKAGSLSTPRPGDQAEGFRPGVK